MQRLVEDIKAVSPETEVRAHDFEMADPWDFEQVFAALHGFARGYAVRARKRGLPRPHHDRHARGADLSVPADRVAATSRRDCYRPRRRAMTAGATRAPSALIDLDLSRYDRIASRFAEERREATSLPEVRHRDAQPPASTG